MKNVSKIENSEIQNLPQKNKNPLQLRFTRVLTNRLNVPQW